MTPIATAQTLTRWLSYAAIAGLLAAPFAWMLALSLRAAGKPLPEALFRFDAAPTLAAFARVFDWVPMANGLVLSALLTLATTVLTWLAASFTGFGPPPLGQQGKWLGGGFLVGAASVPLTAIWVPRFVMFKALGLTGTPLPLLLPALYGLSPLFVLLYYAAFRRLNADAFDAAVLEGSSIVWQWWRAALPQVRATTVAVATLAGMQSWAAFMEPLLYLDREHQQTAPLLLHSLEMLGSTQWSTLMAGAVLVTLPVVLVFAASQNLFRSLGDEKSS